MSRLFKVFLQEAFTATKGSDCFSGCRLKEFFDFGGLAHDLDATATSAIGGLDGYRESVLGNKLLNFLDGFNRINCARS